MTKDLPLLECISDPLSFNGMESKPTLLFFQYKYDAQLPEFLLTHKNEHVKCLSQFFNVIVINYDCDYERICDIYEPDLALFESGVPHRTCRRPKITNVRACAQVPKLGLHNGDPFCSVRAGFLSDMDHWGIETFFSIATTTPDNTRDAADNFFIWPNCVDTTIYRNYDERKNIPVLFTGNTSSLYPWRRQIIKQVSRHYPSLICPHPGYDPKIVVPNLMVGERYARAINASWIVPACGTLAKEVVRKHFEVPACNSCLVAEGSPALEAAGFIDMVNCVFADEHSVLDKLAHLFSNMDQLEAITAAGHQLVFSRHTSKNRDQIIQWFKLHRSLKTNQKIIQPNPFGRLAITETSNRPRQTYIVSNALQIQLLGEGDENLWKGNYNEAEACYLKCLNYIPWMPEPQFKLALCNLYKGNASAALSWVSSPIQRVVTEYGAADPDPVEWAYFIISLLCQGKLDEAVRYAGEFPWLSHPELARARSVVGFLKAGGLAALPDRIETKDRCSLHRLPHRNLDEWIRQLSIILETCGQPLLAGLIRRFPSGEEPVSIDRRNENVGAPLRSERVPSARFPRKIIFCFGSGFFLTTNWMFLRKMFDRFRHIAAKTLHLAETKYGYFLPYHLSAMRNDDFFKRIEHLAREEKIETALILGASLKKGLTKAFLMGIKNNRNRRTIVCINDSSRGFDNLELALANDPTVRCYRVAGSSNSVFATNLERAVGDIIQNGDIVGFDAILIDPSSLTCGLTASQFLLNQLRLARFVVLNDLNGLPNFSNSKELLNRGTHSIICHEPGIRNGFAILKRQNTVDLTDEAPNGYLTKGFENMPSRGRAGELIT